MSGKSYTNRSGKLRFYDGTATPFYLELDFDAGDFSGPLHEPMTEEILKLNRGKADGDSHYIEGSEDKIFEAVQLSFSVMLTSLNISDYFLTWVGALNGETTTINGNTITTTKNTTLRNGVTCPAFADTNKRALNIEVLWDEDSDQGFQYNEVWIPGVESPVSETDDGVVVAATGSWYGSFERITSFTAGTSIEA